MIKPGKHLLFYEGFYKNLRYAFFSTLTLYLIPMIYPFQGKQVMEVSGLLRMPIESGVVLIGEHQGRVGIFFYKNGKKGNATIAGEADSKIVLRGKEGDGFSLNGKVRGYVKNDLVEFSILNKKFVSGFQILNKKVPVFSLQSGLGKGYNGKRIGGIIKGESVSMVIPFKDNALMFQAEHSAGFLMNYGKGDCPVEFMALAKGNGSSLSLTPMRQVVTQGISLDNTEKFVGLFRRFLQLKTIIRTVIFAYSRSKGVIFFK